MSKSSERIDDFPLFYEEIGSGRNDQTLERTKKDSAGLNEDQIAKLGDDLRSPIKGSSSDSNPMQ